MPDHIMASQQQISLPVKVLDHACGLPAYAYPGDAGLDLVSAVDIELAPFERALIPTGISIAIPRGFAGYVLPRSGMAIKHGLTMINAPGLIDADYRGELKVAAVNLDAKTSITISRGDRIAQLVISAVPFVELVQVDELDSTERGTGGFGSSGTKSTVQ